MKNAFSIVILLGCSVASAIPPIERNPTDTNKIAGAQWAVLVSDLNGVPFFTPPTFGVLLSTGSGPDLLSPSFGQMDLSLGSPYITGFLNGPNGGTGVDTVASSVAKGSLLYSSSNGRWGGVLAPTVSGGPLLRCNGAGQPPSWVTDIGVTSITNSAGLALDLAYYDANLKLTYCAVGAPLSIVPGAGFGTLQFGNQTANTVFSGPVSGAAAAPAFRLLVPADGNGGGTLPAKSVYGGGPPYYWSDVAGSQTLIRGGRRRVESYTPIAGTPSMTLIGNALTSGGSATSEAVSSLVPPQYRQFSAGTSASIGGVGGSGLSVSWNVPFYMTYLGNITNVTNVRVVIGFTSGSIANALASADPSTLHNAFMQLDTSVSPNWRFYTSNGAGSTIQTTTIAAATNAACYEVIFDKVNATYRAFINGVELTNSTATLPAGTMRMVVAAETLENLAKAVNVQYIEVGQDFYPNPAP